MMARWRLREIAEPERWNAKKLSEHTGLVQSHWDIDELLSIP